MKSNYCDNCKKRMKIEYISDGNCNHYDSYTFFEGRCQPSNSIPKYKCSCGNIKSIDRTKLATEKQIYYLTRKIKCLDSIFKECETPNITKYEADKFIKTLNKIDDVEKYVDKYIESTVSDIIMLKAIKRGSQYRAKIIYDIIIFGGEV